MYARLQTVLRAWLQLVLLQFHIKHKIKQGIDYHVFADGSFSLLPLDFEEKNLALLWLHSPEQSNSTYTIFDVPLGSTYNLDDPEPSCDLPFSKHRVVGFPRVSRFSNPPAPSRFLIDNTQQVLYHSPLPRL